MAAAWRSGAFDLPGGGNRHKGNERICLLLRPLLPSGFFGAELLDTPGRIHGAFSSYGHNDIAAPVQECLDAHVDVPAQGIWGELEEGGVRNGASFKFF